MSNHDFFNNYLLNRDTRDVVKCACSRAIIHEAQLALFTHDDHQRCQTHIRNMMDYIVVGGLKASPYFYLCHAATEKPELVKFLTDTIIELDRFIEVQPRISITQINNDGGGAK